MSKTEKRKPSGSFIVFFSAAVALIIIILAITTMISTNDEMANEISESSDKVTEKVKKTDKASDTAQKRSSDTVKEETVTDMTGETDDVSSNTAEHFTPVAGYLLKGYDTVLASYSMTMNDYRTHSGIDVCAEVGEPVYSFASGTVSAVYNDSFWGYCVEIEHDKGMKSFYKSLSEQAVAGVEQGSYVQCGQLIGYVGESAKVESVDSPHLHFELTSDGKSVNPLDYLSYEALPDTEANKD